MKYYKKILFSFKYSLYLLIGVFGIILISFIYAIYDVNNLEYFINKYVSLISIGINLLLILFIIWKYKIKFKKINIKKIYPYLYLCLSFTILFNTIMLFINDKSSNNINILILFFSSGIVGPILEELIFRKLIIDELIKFNSKKKTILISSLIFSIIHFNVIKGIYAFIVGLIYGTVYLKNNNILNSIIFHCLANSVVLLISEFNIYILLFSFISLFFSLFLIYKNK